MAENYAIGCFYMMFNTRVSYITYNIYINVSSK